MGAMIDDYGECMPHLELVWISSPLSGWWHIAAAWLYAAHSDLSQLQNEEAKTSLALFFLRLKEIQSKLSPNE